MSNSIESDAFPHEQALRWLLGRVNYERMTLTPYCERTFKLERTERLLERLGNPHHRVPVVHVAGTKGKGSTSVMVRGCLTTAGYRTGLFTSPHLYRIEERFVVDGDCCSGEEFVALIEMLRPVVEAMDDGEGPTYFEITTALAFLHFVRREVDVAVLEVGLGGRLDSTNVCWPVVCAITSISLDHCQQLGDTLGAIAREKAGIVKPGVPTVSGVIEDEPREVIRGICGERGSTLRQLGEDFDHVYHVPSDLQRTDERGRIDYMTLGSTVGCRHVDLSLGMLGRHQGRNAAVAVSVLEELRSLGWNIPDAAIRDGLARSRCEARIEVVSREPVVIVDSAHNVASIRALTDVLEESFSVRRRILIFATTREKEFDDMLGELAGRFDHVLFTRYLSNPRSVPPEDLHERFVECVSTGLSEIAPTPAEAWQRASDRAGPADLICVTGSFFLAAEIHRVIDSDAS